MARPASASVIILVHIDEAIAFLHLPCGGGNQVNGAPHQISEAFHVVLLHGQLKLFQVEPQILNPVAVIHGPIFLKCIHCAQAILSHNQGLPVFAVHCVQEIAKAFRVNGPAPSALL